MPGSSVKPSADGPRKTAPPAAWKRWTVAVLLVACAGLWCKTRLANLRALLAQKDAYYLSVFPVLLSTSVGTPTQPLGYMNWRQVNEFSKRGGDVPGSHLDIRSVPADNSVDLETNVDPGISWIWHAASRFGVPLSVAGIADLQVGVDFLCLVLAIALAWRLAGPAAAVLAGGAYALSAPIADEVVNPGYYFWSVPIALIAGHLLVSAARRRRISVWWVATCAVLSTAIWIRSLWLPVSLAVLAIPLIGGWRRRLSAVFLGLALAAGSYGGTIARSTAAGPTDLLHPREHLWHALYLGLGWYQNFNPIRWDDSYAEEVTKAHGISETTGKRYEALLRGFFFREVRKHPVRYAATLARREGDYVASAAGLNYGIYPAWLSGAGWAALLLALWAAERRRGGDPGFLAVTVFWAEITAVWAIFVPPAVYVVETVGLSYSVLAVAVSALTGVAGRRSAVRVASPAAAEGTAAHRVRLWCALLSVAAGILVLSFGISRLRSERISSDLFQVGTGDPAEPGGELEVPAATSEPIVESHMIWRSFGRTGVVLRSAPTILEGRASVGLFDARRKRWLDEAPLDGRRSYRLKFGDLPFRRPCRVVVAAANPSAAAVALRVENLSIEESSTPDRGVAGVVAGLLLVVAGALFARPPRLPGYRR